MSNTMAHALVRERPGLVRGLIPYGIPVISAHSDSAHDI